MGEFFIASVFVGTLLLLLPVYLRVDAYLDVKENKCWFSISLYKHLKIFGGYGEVIKDGIAIHVTKKKAILISFGKMTETKQKFDIAKGFQLIRFHTILETGGADTVYGLMLGAAITATSGGIFSVLQTKHPFLSLKSNSLLTNHACVKLSLQADTVFNGLIVIVAITKKLLEALINWIRTKKSTASWKKRQNA